MEFSQNFMILRFKKKIIFTIHYIAHIFTFKIPEYGLYRFIKVFRRYVWYRFPIKDFIIPKAMPDGNRIILRWRDHGAACRIYHKSLYDRFFEPKSSDIVVDAGAHVGVYSLKAAKQVGTNGRVIAIEPADENYKLLLKNIAINKARNIIPCKVGLYSSEGRAKFYIKESSMPHSLFKKLEESPITKVDEINITTLDSLLQKLGICHVNILKINVEGAEFDVLKGARNFLAEMRISKIVITTHPPHEQTSKIIVRYLATFNYRVKVVKLKGDTRVIYAAHEPFDFTFKK
jgi:FkbM family methyltransferase